MNLNELTKKHKTILKEIKEKLAKMDLEEVCRLMEKFDELNNNYMEEKKWVKN